MKIFTSEDVTEFIESKGLSFSDFSEDLAKDPMVVAARYMAAWLGYETISLDGVTTRILLDLASDPS